MRLTDGQRVLHEVYLGLDVIQTILDQGVEEYAGLDEKDIYDMNDEECAAEAWRILFILDSIQKAVLEVKPLCVSITKEYTSK